MPQNSPLTVGANTYNPRRIDGEYAYFRLTGDGSEPINSLPTARIRVKDVSSNSASKTGIRLDYPLTRNIDGQDAVVGQSLVNCDFVFHPQSSLNERQEMVNELVAFLSNVDVSKAVATPESFW